MEQSHEKGTTIKKYVLLLIGFCFALLGYLNALPDLGPLPTLGVTPAVILHPTALAVGFAIAAISISRFSLSKKDITRNLFHFALVMADFMH